MSLDMSKNSVDRPSCCWRFVRFVIFAFAVCTFAADDDSLAQSPDQVIASRHAAYPLKASSDNRYLVDQNKTPFLMIGDAPQNLIANLSQADAEKYMANRERYGINTLWINLLCIYSEGNSCNKQASTFDGLFPLPRWAIFRHQIRPIFNVLTK